MLLLTTALTKYHTDCLKYMLGLVTVCLCLEQSTVLQPPLGDGRCVLSASNQLESKHKG